MTNEVWLSRMASELRRRGVAPPLVDQAIAEARVHLADSGADPFAAFGLPESYAAEVASASRTVVTTCPEVGPVRLRARRVGKRYGRRWVFRDVDLTVRAGQAAAVVGANGCGKSTFLRICAGLISPTQGEVVVNGTVGFCPQDGGTVDFLTPDEHFRLVGAGRRLTKAAATAAGTALAAELQWAPDATTARHLSGGTRQKLNLTLAALGDPDVLLLDEPYQGFDRGSYLDFWHQVWRWRAEGKAVVVVTHLLDQLDRVDMVVDLTEGGR